LAAGGVRLTAFYDLAVGPVSFDFVTFLIKAEIARRNAGASHLHVVIVPDPKGPGGMRDKSQFYDQHEGRWRLWNICIPACALVGATMTLASDWLHATQLVQGRSPCVWPPDWDHQTLKERRHLVGDLITWARAGVDIPRLSASPHARRVVKELFARKGRPVVTMTLRNTYLVDRNSNYMDWLMAAKHIASKGFDALIIKDTSAALIDGLGFAEFSLDLRMAAYQEARLNLQANNGAASLCWFSDRPYRMFDAGIPAEEWNGLFVKQGLPLGATWPWASADQKLIYERASKDAIIGEFEAWATGMS
jgi:hypothetical protein